MVTPDNSPGQGESEQAKIEQETRNEIKEEKAQGKNNQEIAAKLLEALQQASDSAERAKEAAENNPLAKNIVPKDADLLAKEAKKSIIKVLTAIKEGVIEVPPKTKKVLEKISQTGINETKAVFIHSFIRDYIEKGKEISFSPPGATEKTQFEKDLEDLKTTNPVAAEIIIKSIIDNPSDFGLTREEAEKKLEISKKKEENKNNNLMTTKENFDELKEKIFDLMKKNANLDNSSPNKLTPEENITIWNFLLGDMETDLEKLHNIAHKIGLEEENISAYRKSFENMFSKPDAERIKYWLTGDKQLTDKIDEAIKVFDINNIRSKYITFDEKGNPQITTEARKALVREINRFYFEALRQVHSDLTNFFQESLSQNHQYYIAGLRGIISNSFNQLKHEFFTGKNGDNDISQFLEDKSGRYLTSIMTYARLFHDLPIYARDATSFEKWAPFVGSIFPSTLAEVFDPDDPIMEVARRAVSMHLRTRLATNKNQVPHDLYSGEYGEKNAVWSSADKEKIKKLIRERMKELSKDSNNPEKEPVELEDWELERAVTYALGIGYSNLVDPEILITADPPVDNDFKGIPPILSSLSPKFVWGAGRGRPAAGHFPHLLFMNVKMFPEQRGFISRVFKKKKWIPKVFHDFVSKQVDGSCDLLCKELLDSPSGERHWLSTDANFQDVLNMLNIASSIISRGGWRVSELISDLKKIIKNKIDANGKKEYELGFDDISIDQDPKAGTKGWTQKEWTNYLNLGTKKYGTSALWWMIDGRAESEIKKYLVVETYEKLLRQNNIDPHNITNKNLADDLWKQAYDIMEKEWPEYVGDVNKKAGEKALERKFNVTIDGESHKLNYLEFYTLRQNQLRGEVFFRHLHRNPGDFLMMLSQLCPQILDLNINYFQSEKGLIKELNDKGKNDPTLKMSAKEIEKILMIRKILEDKWGQAQFNQLGKLRKWLIGISMETDDSGEAIKDKNNKYMIKREFAEVRGINDFNDFIKYFVEQSGIAFEKLVKDRQREDKDDKGRNYRVIDRRPGEIRTWLTKDDFTDKELGQAIFNDVNSFFSILGGKENNPEFSRFGGFDENLHFNFGQADLFFKIGQLWTHKEGNINPFSSDINHFAIYQKMGSAGEDTIKRLLGDADMVKKAFEGIGKLDTFLLEAANSGKTEELDKLYVSIYEALKGTISEEYANRAIYILATIEGKFFQQHSGTRLPFPLNLVFRAFYGKEAALSQILTHNRHAKTMDSEALRTRFRSLIQLHVLNKEGRWSVDQLEEAFDVSGAAYYASELIPSIAIVFIMFLLWAYIKKAFEESEGKKK
jgi:hypothetical protein